MGIFDVRLSRLPRIIRGYDDEGLVDPDARMKARERRQPKRYYECPRRGRVRYMDESELNAAESRDWQRKRAAFEAAEKADRWHQIIEDQALRRRGYVPRG